MLGFVILKACILLPISVTEGFYNCIKLSNFYRNLTFLLRDLPFSVYRNVSRLDVAPMI